MKLVRCGTLTKMDIHSVSHLLYLRLSVHLTLGGQTVLLMTHRLVFLVVVLVFHS